MVVATLYGAFVDHLAQKRIDLDTDTIKVALCTSTYAPNKDTHDFFNDITNEVTGTGYTAGGATLGSVTWTYNSTTDTWTLDAADVVWGSSTITARYAIIYVDTAGASSTDPLIGYVDFESNVSSTAGNFTIQWNASGILTVTV